MFFIGRCSIYDGRNVTNATQNYQNNANELTQRKTSTQHIIINPAQKNQPSAKTSTQRIIINPTQNHQRNAKIQTQHKIIDATKKTQTPHIIINATQNNKLNTKHRRNA